MLAVIEGMPEGDRALAQRVHDGITPTAAQLDDGPMWPTAFAIARMTRATETRVRQLLRAALD